MTISQQQLQQKILPAITASAKHYQKFQPIHARKATEEEVITTVVDGKKETVNTANKGDYIVANLTSSKEHYVVSKDKFPTLYSFSKALDTNEDDNDNNHWDEYLPKGQVQAVEVDETVLSLLAVETTPFEVEAAWGETQRVERGDYLVSPLPQLDEVYRIAKSSFLDTYQLVK